MNGDAHLEGHRGGVRNCAPVRLGATGAEPVGGPESAPVPSVTLMERHRAAMQVIDTCGTESERWDLLSAVVWPESAELQDAA